MAIDLALWSASRALRQEILADNTAILAPRTGWFLFWTLDLGHGARVAAVPPLGAVTPKPPRPGGASQPDKARFANVRERVRLMLRQSVSN